MLKSSAKNPDLDWSQVRETVKLIAVSASQVEASVLKGDHSVSNLTESFTGMAMHLDAITNALDDLEESEAKETIKMHCMMTSERVHTSIIEFQFYDRMKQCLEHVTDNLMGLSDIIETPKLLYNPDEWQKLQNFIRSGYSMESEKIMFDAILQGKSIQEAIALYEAHEHQDDDDDIELF